jgi:hypothetical protein
MPSPVTVTATAENITNTACKLILSKALSIYFSSETASDSTF